MPPSFDWEIREEFKPPEKIVAGKPPSDPQHGWLRRAAVVVAVVVVLGLGIRAAFVARLKAVGTAERALREIVQLELKSIADGDQELYRALQDPDDSDWRRQQVARFVSNRADTFTPVPGLTPADGLWEIKKVHAVGRTGRVDLERSFVADRDRSWNPRAADTTKPLPFRITWFYRESDDGSWVHVVPPDDYIGVPHSWHGSRLEVRATEAEAELLDLLAPGLVSMVSHACWFLNCPEGARFTLSFEDTLAPHVRGSDWVMPALYLAGLPEDEVSRAFWLGAAKTWMVETLVQSRVGRRDLGERVIYRQLATRVKGVLGLAELLSPDVELLAQGLRDGAQHSLDELMMAERDAVNLEEARLLDAEAAALLQFLATRVGSRQLFRLLPALGDRTLSRDDVLLETFDLNRDQFSADWSAYLSDLTGEEAAVEQLAVDSIFPLPHRMPPPPVHQAPTVPPGDQVALLCDGRVWAGNADGSRIAALTASEDRFTYVQWSPDGRWLLTTWQPHVPGIPSVLYLLHADGDGGRVLTDTLAAHIVPIGWSPDGRQAIFAIWYRIATFPMQYRSVDVETGRSERLGGIPSWSPDGRHLTYVIEAFGSAWLADTDWGNAHPIADRAWAAWQEGNWSPDSAQLALQLDGAHRAQSRIAIFNQESGTLRTLITSEELTNAILSFEGDVLSDGADPSVLSERPLRWTWPFGWSADGSQILVWAQTLDRTASGPGLSALAVVPVDGSAPQVLAYTKGVFLGSAAWSPSNPDRVAFAWLPQEERLETPITVLYDLKAGPLYRNAESRSATWSPDGRWLAVNKKDRVVIIDEAGTERYTLAPADGASCSSVVWNPAADLSLLQDTTAPPSSERVDHSSPTTP